MRTIACKARRGQSHSPELDSRPMMGHAAAVASWLSRLVTTTQIVGVLLAQLLFVFSTAPTAHAGRVVPHRGQRAYNLVACPMT